MADPLRTTEADRGPPVDREAARREAARATADAQKHAAEFRARLGRVYANPEAADRAFRAYAEARGGEQGAARAAQTMYEAPEQFGALRAAEVGRVRGLVQGTDHTESRQAAGRAAIAGREALHAEAAAARATATAALSPAAQAVVRDVAQLAGLHARQQEMARAELRAELLGGRAEQTRSAVRVAEGRAGEFRSALAQVYRDAPAAEARFREAAVRDGVNAARDAMRQQPERFGALRTVEIRHLGGLLRAQEAAPARAAAGEAARTGVATLGAEAAAARTVHVHYVRTAEERVSERLAETFRDPAAARAAFHALADARGAERAGEVLRRAPESLGALTVDAAVARQAAAALNGMPARGPASVVAAPDDRARALDGAARDLATLHALRARERAGARPDGRGEHAAVASSPTTPREPAAGRGAAPGGGLRETVALSAAVERARDGAADRLAAHRATLPSPRETAALTERVARATQGLGSGEAAQLLHGLTAAHRQVLQRVQQQVTAMVKDAVLGRER